ncbi:MAG: hypothetical protein Q8S92_22265 [Hydrogenophaga sp.]|uniref:hypothetical protein n=1 Tax=Hydrogenophaga sp. TaxID=1904254 RepID=UPI0027324D57|nr:hypothetical protein [Hydrogenophaga sp.]MDP3351719.1 hypothetical protein [Hydrogenophaga sp.]
MLAIPSGEGVCFGVLSPEKPMYLPPFTKLAQFLVPGDVVILDDPVLGQGVQTEATVRKVSFEQSDFVTIGFTLNPTLETVVLPATRVVKLKVPPIMEFPHELTSAEHPQTSRYILGFEFEGTAIADPSMSQCSRFEVSPETYGLTEDHLQALADFNNAFDDAVVAAIRTFEQAIEKEVGIVEDVGTAAIYANPVCVVDVRNALIEHAAKHVAHAKSVVAFFNGTQGKAKEGDKS